MKSLYDILDTIIPFKYIKIRIENVYLDKISIHLSIIVCPCFIITVDTYTTLSKNTNHVHTAGSQLV
jgi:hypothetical protein